MNAGEIAALGIRKATGLSEEVILPALFHGSFFWMTGSLAEGFVENSKIPPGGIRLKKWRETGFHPKRNSWFISIGECTKKPPVVLRRAGGGIFGKPYLVSSSAAWAAARRATGTLNGEQLT
jgi:hypothetical protein